MFGFELGAEIVRPDWQRRFATGFLGRSILVAARSEAPEGPAVTSRTRIGVLTPQQSRPSPDDCGEIGCASFVTAGMGYLRRSGSKGSAVYSCGE